MKDKKFIAFDIGAESGRCIVAALINNKIVLDEVHRFPRTISNTPKVFIGIF